MAKNILKNIIKELDNSKNYSLNELQLLLNNKYNEHLHNTIINNNVNNFNNTNDINDTIKNVNTLNNDVKNVNNDVFNNATNKFCVFTDGSCINNGKKNAVAGYAIVWPYLQELNYSERLYDKATNNRAEYKAVIKAIEKANEYDKKFTKTLSIYTDSELLVKSITKWIKQWKKNGWKTANNKDVLNKDLLLIIDDLMKLRKIEFIHVLAHTNKNDLTSKWNDIVDREAKKTIKTKKLNILDQFTTINLQ